MKVSSLLLAAVSSTSVTAYNYGEVVSKSLLFYEAQRSGHISPNNRIPWRADAHLWDQGINGEDLVGGYYDAGDLIKFNFPQAATATLLAWSAIESKDTYKAIGEWDNQLAAIRWATDFLLKCHVSDYELYAQVGDGHLDHSQWTRPEDDRLPRPSFKITAEKPGSDLAGETSAAFAAASVVFADEDPDYSAKLLRHAEVLFSFADNHRGLYQHSIPEAADFYGSTGYGDELVWAATWLSKATGNATWTDVAEERYAEFWSGGEHAGADDAYGWAFSWDDKIAGFEILLAEQTGKQKYHDLLGSYFYDWSPEGSISYTPKGLAWRLQWGPNRYAATTAFLALVYGDVAASQQVQSSVDLASFAKSQMNYILGDTGRSYVIGFGVNSPQRPHHRGSSCSEDLSQSCSWDDYNNPGPSPNVLVGALVGGPDVNDHYEDLRSDYIANEVALDYNAGFHGAAAKLASQ